VVAFPAGEHQILNHSEAPARVLICATDDFSEAAGEPENQMLAILTTTGQRLVPETLHTSIS
jgi:hypothetical protein